MPSSTADVGGPERSSTEGEGTVLDLLKIDVAPGTRVLVASDLHLRGSPTEASRWAVPELVKVLDSWEGPGLLVFAGDLLELWAGPAPDAKSSLAAHPELTAAVRRFAGGEGRRVLYLIGNHDGRVAWDPASIEAVREALPVELALAAELSLPTPQGRRTVRVEHGHRFDPTNCFTDPRNPVDTPTGQHIVQEVLPSLAFTQDGWLDGVESLSDPRTFPAFISSRVFYRRVLRRAMWLLLPVALALLLRFPLTYELLTGGGRLNLGPFSHKLILLDLAVVLDVLIIGGLLFWGVRRAWTSASSVVAEKRGKAQNDNSRAAAKQLVDDGYAGLVCAHTHHPELSSLGTGFYANTGSGTKVVDRVDARFGLPHVFLPRIQLSWVELVADADWRVTLTAGRRELPGSTGLERRVTRRDERIPARPSVVGVFPEPGS